MGVGREEGGYWVSLVQLKTGDLEGENYKKQYSEREHYQALEGLHFKEKKQINFLLKSGFEEKKIGITFIIYIIENKIGF